MRAVLKFLLSTLPLVSGLALVLLALSFLTQFASGDEEAILPFLFLFVLGAPLTLLGISRLSVVPEQPPSKPPSTPSP